VLQFDGECRIMKSLYSLQCLDWYVQEVRGGGQQRITASQHLVSARSLLLQLLRNLAQSEDFFPELNCLLIQERLQRSLICLVKSTHLYYAGKQCIRVGEVEHRHRRNWGAD
jgi:hypothetical protein